MLTYRGFHCGQTTSRRDGIASLAAVLIGFTYVFASKVISVWAASVGLPPWSPVNEHGLRLLAAWLPNVLFACLGWWLYARAPK